MGQMRHGSATTTYAPHSTALTGAEEAMVVALRGHTLPTAERLPLRPAVDDPPSDTIDTAPLSAAPRHLTPA